MKEEELNKMEKQELIDEVLSLEESLKKEKELHDMYSSMYRKESEKFDLCKEAIKNVALLISKV